MSTFPIAKQAPQKWALLIGVDEYPRLPQHFHLRGCINDVEAIEGLLTSEQFAFPAANILKLTSPARSPAQLATRDNILHAFRQHLVENGDIRSGDVVVIYYSGHGSQIPDEEGDEDDGLDETIVPCDAGPNRSRREDVLDISDDELSLMLDQLAVRTRNINLIFDSCHAGTVSRALPDAQGKDRFLPPATYAITAPSLHRPRGSTRSMGPSDWVPLSDGYILISACMSQERAREDRFGFFRGKQYGILTYYLLEAMQDVGPETTYYDIWDAVRVKVTKRNRWQNPQIEGAFERKVFGGAALPRRRYVEVTGKDGGNVILAAGLAQGATAGSRFAVYRPGDNVFDNQRARLAVVRLERVDAFNSVGRVEEGNVEEIEVNAPAIEIEHDYGTMQMGVSVRGNDALLDAVREQVKDSPLLNLVANADEESTAEVRLLYPMSADGQEQSDTGAMLVIVHAGDGYPLVEPITPDVGSPTVVRQKLEHMAVYYNVLALRNTDQKSALKGKIKLIILRMTGKDENNRDVLVPVERNAGGDIVLRVGERVVLEVENLSNQALHIALLDYDTSWGITPIFPPQGAADDTVNASSRRRTHRFTVQLPGHQKTLGDGHPLPREIVRVIATTRRVNFRSLWQRGTRSFGEKFSLYRLMQSAIRGGRERVTRALVEDTDEAVNDWTTAEVVFYIAP
jgi:hypothetical protein